MEAAFLKLEDVRKAIRDYAAQAGDFVSEATAAATSGRLLEQCSLAALSGAEKVRLKESKAPSLVIGQ
jgi:hypothetical protein